MAVAADVTDSDQVKRATDQILEAWDGVDNLVNNAGIIRVGSVTQGSEEDMLGPDKEHPVDLSDLPAGIEVGGNLLAKDREGDGERVCD